MKPRVEPSEGITTESTEALAAPTDLAAFHAQDDVLGSTETRWSARAARRGVTSLVSRWVPTSVLEIFAADVRSLAALRIVLAVIVLVDLAGRARNLLAHYTDDGVLPRHILLDEAGILRPSLNWIGGTTVVQTLLFGITALAAVALLVGYRTRVMNVVVWVMVLSIQNRNPFVLSAEDALLRLLLFWSMFLPLGAWWSVDSLRDAPAPRVSMRVLSMASAGLFLQIAFVYWFTVIRKSGPEWRIDGTAIYYALSVDQITGSIGSYLLQFPALLRVLTFAVLGIEVIGPLLLFCPVATGPVRTAGVLMIMSLHFGILLTMMIWVFPWLSAFCMVCFLPSWFWDQFMPQLRAAFSMHANLGKRFRSTAASVAQAWAAPRWRRLSTGESAGPLLFAASTPSAYADQRGVAHPAHRTMPWSAQSRQGPENPMTVMRSSLAVNLLAFFFLGYVFFMNVTTVSDYTMPTYARPLGELLGLRQDWSMFAPAPRKVTDWFVIPGTLHDGRQVDLLASIINRNPDLIKSVSWKKPPHIPTTFRDLYWVKYLLALEYGDWESRRLYFGKYICRTWNAWHPDGPLHLQTFQILAFKERTVLDGGPETSEHRVLWTHRCR